VQNFKPEQAEIWGQQRPPHRYCRWATITLHHVQHGWWQPSWKSLWRHNSVTDDPILLKFGTPMENHMPITVKRLKLKPEVELFLENRNSNISAVNWDIGSKFGMPIALDLLKCHMWPNHKPEVDFRRYGCHLV